MFTHARNSQFQYVYFIAGKAHTADEAYRLLKDQLEERETAIALEEANALRREEKRFNASRSDSKYQITAELLELDAAEKTLLLCREEAVRERDFLLKMIEVIQPYRRYSHLPDHEAYQACQQEEWMLELMFRAENQLLQNGTISADLWEAMRLHPNFTSQILPHINQVQSTGQKQLLGAPAFKKPLAALLPNPEARPALPDYPMAFLAGGPAKK